MEGKRIAEKIPLNFSDYYFYGCGLSYHIHEFLNKLTDKKQTPTLWCLEPIKSIFILPEVQEEIAILKEKASKQNITLHFDLAENFSLKLPDNSFNVLPFYSRTLPLETQSFLNQHIAKNETVNERTIGHFEKVWLFNYIRNLDALVLGKQDIYSVSSLKQIFQNKTIVFTGASPELENQLHWIVNNRSGFYLIASDTSTDYLLQNGVVPDFILSIDSGRGTSFHFTNNIPKTIPVITWLGGIHRLFQQTQPIYLYASTFPLDQILANQQPEMIIENPTLNISGLAYNLCKMTGVRQLLFAGISFVSQKGKSHCRGTGYTFYKLPQIHRKNSLEMYHPGYYKKEVSDLDKKNNDYIQGDHNLSVQFITGNESLPLESKLPKIQSPSQKLRFDGFLSLLHNQEYYNIISSQNQLSPHSLRRFSFRLRRINIR